MLTEDLQRVLEARNPDVIDILIEAEPGKSRTVRNQLDRMNISYTSAQVGNRTVFEASIETERIPRVETMDGVLRLDHSPTFSPLRSTIDKDPGTMGLDVAENLNRITLADAHERLGVPGAWGDYGTKGDGAVVGLIDTPIDESHPAIEHAVVGTRQNTSQRDHGTWTASAMVGRETETPDGTIHGAAPEADLYAHGALGRGGASAIEILDGIQWLLDQNVDVINMSLGGPHSDILHDAVIEAEKGGALVVSSAGNSGPADGSISCPAHHEEPIAVGSIDTNDNVSAFSSRGPGWRGESKPDVVAYGGGAAIGPGGRLVATEVVLGAGARGQYKYQMGTSMAGPEVAGIAALHVANNRGGGGE